MFKTTCTYHEAYDDGSFDFYGSETLKELSDYEHPRTYFINTEKEPTSKELDDLFWQMVEIECIADGKLILIEQLTEKDDEYHDYDQAFVKVHVERTEEPSSFIDWGTKTPNIFKVNRNKSSYDIEFQKC